MSLSVEDRVFYSQLGQIKDWLARESGYVKCLYLEFWFSQLKQTIKIQSAFPQSQTWCTFPQSQTWCTFPVTNLMYIPTVTNLMYIPSHKLDVYSHSHKLDVHSHSHKLDVHSHSHKLDVSYIIYNFLCY
jgi:hypothetical protein